MIIVRFSKSDLKVIHENTIKACFGGQSSFVKDRDERARKLIEHNYLGQLGEAALSVYLTGSIHLYITTRALRNKDIYSGDGGSDLLGWDVDIKTSRETANPGHLYHLWVRPNEYHRKNKYYLGLVPKYMNDRVTLAGWIPGHALKYDPELERYSARQDTLYPVL